MTAHPIYLVADKQCKEHQTGFGHPERPERFDAIFHSLMQNKILNKQFIHLKSRIASDDEILLCHSKYYYEIVVQEISALQDHPTIVRQLSTGDVNICSRSLKTAKLSIGGVLNAIDAVFNAGSECNRAFCIVRPPGHHACSDRGMGFCLFNNIAIAGRYAQKKYGVKRVLIVDWDVHHGNGTQEIFNEDSSLFYFSTHQYGHYPMTGFEDETGIGKGKSFTLNCPIKPGRESRLHVIEAFQTKLLPKMNSFQPELVLISCGFDAHEKDPLGNFNLADEDFFTLTEIVKKIANQYASGRIVSILEGGYNLEALGSASAMHVQSLISD